MDSLGVVYHGTIFPYDDHGQLMVLKTQVEYQAD